jgi:hypothetical protein
VICESDDPASGTPAFRYVRIGMAWLARSGPTLLTNPSPRFVRNGEETTAGIPASAIAPSVAGVGK